MNARAAVLASARVLGLVLPQVLVLAACGRPAGFPAQKAQAGAEAPDPGYRAPPQVGAVVRAADGSVSLRGRALPSSQVRMVSPAGARIETRADGSGAWSAPIGPVSEPALYRLAEEAGGQRVEAEGLVAVLPGAPTVALLRAGFGAEVVQAAGDPPLTILAVDYDSTGAAVVSGLARAGVPVRVAIDGEPVMDGAAGPAGRFSLALPKPLPPGRHRIQVQTPQAQALQPQGSPVMAEADVTVSPPSPPKDAPYQAQADSFGWRVDWTTPGGGAQTTLLPAALAAGG